MNLFSIENKVILITGGGGILGGEMASYLLRSEEHTSELQSL